MKTDKKETEVVKVEPDKQQVDTVAVPSSIQGYVDETIEAIKSGEITPEYLAEAEKPQVNYNEVKAKESLDWILEAGVCNQEEFEYMTNYMCNIDNYTGAPVEVRIAVSCVFNAMVRCYEHVGAKNNEVVDMLNDMGISVPDESG